MSAATRRGIAGVVFVGTALLAGCAMPLANDGELVTIRHDPEVDMARVMEIALEQCAQAGQPTATLKHTAILNTLLPAAMVPRVSTFRCEGALR